MIKYQDFINETKLTGEKDGFHLELNDNGELLPPFQYYRQEEMDSNNYFVLKSIPYEEYLPIDHGIRNRVTLLKGSTYQDTVVPNKRGDILRNVNFNEDNYYFYQMFSTPVMELETLGVTIKYKEDPERFDVQLTQDGRLHFIVIEKNSEVTSVRLNHGSRSGGDRAERIIGNKFGWSLQRTKIKKVLIQNKLDDNRNIIPHERREAILKDVLKTDLNTLNTYKDIFVLDNIYNAVSKYDLIITDGQYAGKKIEVKRYDIKEIFYTTFRQDGDYKKDILIAEQLKISTKFGLKKLVELYKEMNPTVDIQPLIANYRIDKGEQLSNYFNIGLEGQYKNLIDNIRKFYNDKIAILKNKYEQIDNHLIMMDVFGIYFFNNDSGEDGFLIKNEDDNLEYYWKLIKGTWGLYRISLVAKVDPSAKKHVWAGDLNTFIETFDVGDIETIQKDTIENTAIGTIVWDNNKGYWVTQQ